MSMEDDTVGYIGVSNGAPIFAKCGDDRGDCLELVVYAKVEDAQTRFFNIRRVRLVVDPEPLCPPADWGSVDD